MTEILQWVQAGSTPFTAFLAYLVWDLRRNHVVHMERNIVQMAKDIAFLNGRQKERDENDPA